MNIKLLKQECKLYIKKLLKKSITKKEQNSILFANLLNYVNNNQKKQVYIILNNISEFMNGFINYLHSSKDRKCYKIYKSKNIVEYNSNIIYFVTENQDIPKCKIDKIFKNNS